MRCFGEILSDIVMPELETSETESTLELNFIIGKIKHSVKSGRKKQDWNFPFSTLEKGGDEVRIAVKEKFFSDFWK